MNGNKIKGYKSMAERKGFEPSKACTLHAFQACSFNHSDTSLKLEFYPNKNKKALNPKRDSKIILQLPFFFLNKQFCFVVVDFWGKHHGKQVSSYNQKHHYHHLLIHNNQHLCVHHVGQA